MASAGAGSAGVEAYRLRSYPTPRKGVDSAPIGHNWTICQAARATSAAPPYFSPLEIESQLFQYAGASGFNNPTLEGLQEAELRWPPSKHEYVVISLGTGLASLLTDSEDTFVVNSGNGNNNIGTTKVRLEHLTKQLVRVATDSERADVDALKSFAKW